MYTSAMQLLSSLDETTDFSDTEGSAMSDVEDAADGSSDDYDSEDSPMPPAGRIQETAVAQKSDPKKNLIANQLHSIVNSDMNFRGAVCFEKTYQSVPNPALRLEGPGRVGLPVNSRDVCAIKEHSRAMKSGPRVTVNAEDAWEMEPSRVAFDNPAWSGFLNSIVEDICKALAIGFLSSKPRCELQKLLLQGQSSILPLAQEKTPNMAFATLIITLPCTFKGGKVIISHAGRSTKIDQSRDSLLNTCAMAWYNGLTPTFERITAGHRLVLHYQLIHTTNSPFPVLPSPSRATDRLGKVLASWKKSVSDQDAPRKIVYLLDHKYSEANLTADGLKGRDAYILSVLKNVAETEGFKLLLAHLELFAQGEASCGPRQKWGSRQYCHSDNDSDREETKGADPSRLKYQDPSDVEHELELSNLRTLDGTPVKDRVDLLEMLFPTEMKAVESIPGDLKAMLERGKPDSVNYDEPESSWMGGTLCRWFRRSVLIICPTEHYSPFIHGIVSSEDALDTLRSSSSTSPTEQETSLVDCVLSAPGKYSKEELEDTLRVVTACACRWGDFELWRKAMDACQGWKGIYRVQSSGLLSALLSLPFNSVSQSVLRVITSDKTRSKRLSFAYAACQELKPVGLSVTWILEALKADIKSIGSLKSSELDLLVMTTLSAGGMPGFEKHILTELKASSNPRCRVTIAYRLQQELSSADTSKEFSKEERSRAKRAINDLLSSATSDWEPYWNEFEQPNPLFLLGRAAVRQPSADVPVQLIKAAVESKNVGLIKTLTLKLTDVPERGDEVEVSPKDAVRLVAFPTLKEIVKYLQDNPPEESISNVVRQLKRGLSQVALEHRDSHRHDLPIIFQAVGEELNADYLQNDLVPQFCKLHHDLSAYEAFCQQLGVWKNESSDPELRETIDNSIKHLLKTAANNSKSQYTHAPLLVKRILKLCAQVGVVDFCSYIFSRLAEQAATVVTQHADNYVIASLGTFRQWLLEQGHGPQYASFPELARAIVSAWRKKALGPMPAGVTRLFSAINGITCACQHCAQVKYYLWVLNPYEKRLNQIGRVNINHVSETTLPHCGTVVRWRPIESKPEPSLWMRKTDETIQSLVWLGKKRSGLEALQRICEDEVTLKQVLGEDEYQHILVALHVDYINAPLPAAPAQQAESSLSAASASTRRSSASAGNERPAKRRKITTA